MVREKKPSKRIKRRARGTGSIFHSKRLGLWIGRVKNGKKTDGKVRYAERRAPTLELLLAKLTELRPPGPETTVAEWCERWHKDAAVAASTRDDRRDALNRFILPTLGPLRLIDLTAGQVEFAARQWSAAGLGNGTVRKYLSQLRTCLEMARRSKLIPDNPVRDARKPKPPRSKIQPFTPAELASIIDEAACWPQCRLIALLASIGCRIGEALALDVADYLDGHVRIHRTYSRKHGLRRTKSENGIRTVRVPAQALPTVKPLARSGPLFPDSKGDRRWHHAVQQSWMRLLRRLGLKYRNLHQLRHSVATHSLAAGVPIADIARDLGDSPATIMRTYIHPTGATTADAMERILASVECTKGVSVKRPNRSTA